MQKMRRKIVLVLITLFLVIICNNCSFAANSVTNRASSNTSQNSSNADQENEINETEDNNVVSNETSENETIEEHMELSYPDVKEPENTFGPLTTEQIIGGSAILMALVAIILVISLYARSRKDYEDDWNEEEENFYNPPEREEPKAMQELKKEENIEQPKAVQEMEDKKKIEEIKRAREEDNLNGMQEESNIEENVSEYNVSKEPEENKIDKEDTDSFNYKHQKALDDFYNYAEEIKKEEKKPKRGKGKHSM